MKPIFDSGIGSYVSRDVKNEFVGFFCVGKNYLMTETDYVANLPDGMSEKLVEYYDRLMDEYFTEFLNRRVNGDNK